MTLKNGRRLLKLREHPRSIPGVLLWLPLKRLLLRRFQREAPMQVDAAEGCRLLKARESNTSEYLCGRSSGSGLAHEIEGRRYPARMVEEQPLRELPLCPFC